MADKKEPKKWRVTVIVTDTPDELEDYLNSNEIGNEVINGNGSAGIETELQSVEEIKTS